MDALNISSVIENLRKQTEQAKQDALQNQQNWLEVALRADGGLIMLGEIAKALDGLVSETGNAGGDLDNLIDHHQQNQPDNGGSNGPEVFSEPH